MQNRLDFDQGPVPHQPPLAAAKAAMRTIFFHENPSRFLEQQVPIYLWNTVTTTGRRRREMPLSVAFLDVKPLGYENKPTVLFFPGMFESIDSPRPETLAYADGLGMRFMTVDYASYGNFQTFLKEFPRFLKEQNVGKDVILSGTSLGGAVAQYVNHMPEFSDRVRGMILSHTAHPSSSPHWGNMQFKVLRFVEKLEHVIPWGVAKLAITKGNERGGLQSVTPRDDMTDLDRAVYDFTLADSTHQQSLLNRKRVASYIACALGVTRGARSAKRRECFDSTVPVLWISTKDDPLMFTRDFGEVQKVYPSATIYEFPAQYGHHTSSCRKEGLMDQIVPFLQKVASIS